MKFVRFLVLQNCRKNFARTFSLGLVAAVLSLTIFGSSLVIFSLQNGLGRFQERLGADILVLPKAAQEDGSFEGVLVQGRPVNFYMDASYLTILADVPGVERVAPQFFLASANAGCCSVAVQLVGFDPLADFTIQPWILERYAEEIGTGDILVGSRISVPKDRMLKFYNTPCRVVGRLSPTGTGMDTAIYTNMATIRTIMKQAAALDFAAFQDIKPEQTISSVLIKTAPDFSPEAVAAAIGQAHPQLAAKPAHGMIRSVEQGLGAITGTISSLLLVVWLFGIGLLWLAFKMVLNERRKEFAVLIISGATRALLSRIIFVEAFMITSLGSVGGIFVGAVLLLPFDALFKDSFARPYLLPDAVEITLLAAGAFFVVLLSGVLSAVWTVRCMDMTWQEDI